MLKLYRASAGSGKTFTLAVEYIKLLIINQRAYQHILAVTFTNKATAEMKERVLSTLYGLAYGLEGADGYLNAIRQAEEIQALGIGEEELRRRAGVALGYLAHDYSRFHIETIDSFFISVIKDLARELDLTANLNVDLNQEEVLDEAVDNIISGLTEGTPTMESIKDFIQEKIDAESNWKIDAEVKEFGENIFNEHYLAGRHLIADKIQDPRFIAAYKQQLNALKTEVLRNMQEAGKAFMEACAKNGLTAEDFKQKERGVWKFFSTLAEGRELPEPNSYVLACREGADGWCSRDGRARHLVEEQLAPLLEHVFSHLDQARQTLASVAAIRRHLNHLQLLDTISRKVDELNNEAGRFLLANSAHFLERMIDKSNVPFIYEKSGTRFEHIMIDEFQDTSALQWHNFLPLLSNSLDSGHTCLVVGDVKQSIYRFRNSDWQILNGLGHVPELQGRIDERVLEYNRRSLGNIIDFNNAFFRLATAALNSDYRLTHGGEDSAQLLRAYSDVEQRQLDSKRGKGYVHIEALAKPEGDGADDYDYEAETLKRLLAHVRRLTAQGVRERDITILLRYNKHIPIISNYFAQEAPDIKLISDEAYQLGASVSVSLLILAMRHLATPADKFSLVLLVSHYRRFVCHEPDEDNERFSRLLISDTAQLEAMLPEAYVGQREKLVFQPLKELAEQLYALFSLQEIDGQDAYLFYFHDQLAAYAADHKTDLSSFLTYWDEILARKTITGSVSDGVRIMSIHKSKGLEFHTVIIPFCDWTTTGKPTELLWCTPERAPFDALKLVPVNFTEETHQSIFAPEYEHEVLLNNVDNLNLLYVAFTRVVCNLFILTERPTPSKTARKKKGPEGEDSIKNVKQLISRSMPPFMESREPRGEDENDAADGGSGRVWEYGTLAILREEKTHEDDNVLTREPEKLAIRFRSDEGLPEFKQSNKSKEFIASQAEKSEYSEYSEDSDYSEHSAPPLRSYTDKGLLYHAIFQQIRTLNDIDRIIDKMNMEGHFRTLAERDEVSRNIHQAFDDPFAARWFGPEWRVVNERAILQRDTTSATGWKEYRADRVILSERETVVIDYKTGHFSREHAEQVKTYMQLLTRMGYPDVKGYVWYIMTGKTHKVNI